MQYNKEIEISVGNSRKAVVWQLSSLMWSEFVERLQNPLRGSETMGQYLNLPKSEQSRLKDVGGFVGGVLKDGRRKAGHVIRRDLVTLDLDSIPAGQTENILKRVGGLGCSAFVYSTRKHAQWAPRLRVVIPLSEGVSSDKYEPLARKLASLIGMEYCDPTTFQDVRLMYWPSCCQDGEYIAELFDKPFCNADSVLAMYGDWKNVKEWPQVPGADVTERRLIAKQEDPTTKKGVVGAFCRCYNVLNAMDTFLPGIYVPTDEQGRYTYTGGSTTGGAVVYDGDIFLYSHHSTDPCSGILVNAFDLVRVHKFGDLDAESSPDTPTHKLPSFKAMTELAGRDKAVRGLLLSERKEEARNAFSTPVKTPKAEAAEEDMSWVASLSYGGNGQLQKTIANAVLILEQDPSLKGKVVYDEFVGAISVTGPLPWDSREEQRRWTDVDDANWYQYAETLYGISGKEKLDNAVLIVSDRHKVNAVKEYLESLVWDGKARLDTLAIDYLGAEDNIYTRATMRKSLCAAVARAITAGVKYDTMPIFVGAQGVGKSTFLRLLGKEWFSDSITSFEGKEAAEMIQGTWINEVGELTGFRKSEMLTVKQFLTKSDDIFRKAYGKRTQKYPRRCVFFGTSNEDEFLRDPTGNRRFWPIDVGVAPMTKNVFRDLPGEVDQIWAEARVRWQMGEKLFLNAEEEALADIARARHRETSGKEGIIQEFLDKPVPTGWAKMDLLQRRMFRSGQMAGVQELEPLKRVCAVEIWVECFNGDIKNFKQTDARELNALIGKIPGWTRLKSSYRSGFYGFQRGFERM